MPTHHNGTPRNQPLQLHTRRALPVAVPQARRHRHLFISKPRPNLTPPHTCTGARRSQSPCPRRGGILNEREPPDDDQPDEDAAPAPDHTPPGRVGGVAPHSPAPSSVSEAAPSSSSPQPAAVSSGSHQA